MDLFTIKSGLSIAALLLTCILFLPYIRSIRRGATVPHFFSWLVWAFGTYIIFAAQLADGAGVGAWPIGFSAVMTSVVAVMAVQRRKLIRLVSLDWVLLVLAISALPLWYITDDPLLTVILLTGADLVGFGPTLRHAYYHPYQEHASFFAMGGIRNILVILALENYSYTTVLFPAAVAIACVLVVSIILWLRRWVSKPAHYSK